VPCGIPQVVMTSVAAELLREGDAQVMPMVRERVVGAFCDVFGAAVVAHTGTL
jgi:lipoate-protein ligase B